MTVNDVLQILLYLAVLLALTKPLGVYMARVYEGERTVLDPVLGPVERLLYRAAGVRPDEGMSWKTYTLAMLVFNALSLLLVYVMQRIQGWLPLNPQQFGAVSADSAFNTAASFATNSSTRSSARSSSPARTRWTPRICPIRCWRPPPGSRPHRWRRFRVPWRMSSARTCNGCSPNPPHSRRRPRVWASTPRPCGGSAGAGASSRTPRHAVLPALCSVLPRRTVPRRGRGSGRARGRTMC